MIARIAKLLRVQQPAVDELGLLLASGTTVPTAGTAGYQTGCIFQHTDGGAGTALYRNEGTVTSCSFVAIATTSNELSANQLAAVTGANAPTALNVFATMTDLSAGGALADGKILIGNGAGAATAVTPAGDVTITNLGATAITADSVINADVKSDAAIAYSKLAALATGQVLVGNAGTPTATTVSGDVTIGATGAVAIGSGKVTNAMVTTGIDPTKLSLASGSVLVGDGTNAAAVRTISGDMTINSSGVAAIAAGVIANADINTAAAIALSKLGADDLASFTGAVVPGTDAIPILDAGTLKSSTYQVIMNGAHDLAAFTGAVVPGTDGVMIDDAGVAKASTYQVFADGLDDLTAKAAVSVVGDKVVITDSAAAGVAKNITVQYLLDVLGDLTDLAAVPAIDDRVALTDESVAGDPAKSTTVENFFSALGDVTALAAAPAIDDLTVVTDESAAGDPIKAITIQQLFDASANLAAGAVVDGNSIIISQTGVAKLEAVADLATLFAGKGLTATSSVIDMCDTVWPMAAFGTWAIDGDGAETAGAGTVGDVVLTQATAAFCKCNDGGVYSNLAVKGAGYAANYQIFPDVPVQADAVLFGDPVKFCEIAADMGQVATYDAASVIEWKYWNGASFATLPIEHDGSGNADATGGRPFQRDGAISFIPPTDWASSTIDSQAAYWIEAVIATGKAANITQLPITNSKNHEIVTPRDGFTCPAAGTINNVRAIDAAGTLHTTADIKFIIMNYTTGAHTAELTWAQDQRQDQWNISGGLVVADGDELGVLVTQEDGAAEASNVMLELEVTPS